MVALLTLCAALAAEPELKLVWPEPVDGVPQPPRLPPGLPAPIHVTEPVTGTLLPTPRDTMLGQLVDRLTAPDGYPGVVKTAVEARGERVRQTEQAACNGQLAVLKMQMQAADAREDVAALTWWDFVPWGAALLGTGILAGFLGAVAVSR